MLIFLENCDTHNIHLFNQFSAEYQHNECVLLYIRTWCARAICSLLRRNKTYTHTLSLRNIIIIITTASLMQLLHTNGEPIQWAITENDSLTVAIRFIFISIECNRSFEFGIIALGPLLFILEQILLDFIDDCTQIHSAQNNGTQKSYLTAIEWQFSIASVKNVFGRSEKRDQCETNADWVVNKTHNKYHLTMTWCNMIVRQQKHSPQKRREKQMNFEKKMDGELYFVHSIGIGALTS